VQERVVDHFGKFFVRIVHGFECMPAKPVART